MSADFLSAKDIVGVLVPKLDTEGLKRAILDRFETLFEDADRKAISDIAMYQKNELTKVFNACVEDFYDSYAPKSYRRKGELFDVLDLDTFANSDGTYEITEDFEPFNKHAISGRDGSEDPYGIREYLYEIVFQKGWHGGADKISPAKAEIWGEHPSPETPYWRKPGFITDKETGERFWHSWGAWHINAEPSSSPYDKFKKELKKGGKLDQSEGSVMYDRYGKIVDMHSNPVLDKFVKEELPGLVERYLPDF